MCQRGKEFSRDNNNRRDHIRNYSNDEILIVFIIKIGETVDILL